MNRIDVTPDNYRNAEWSASEWTEGAPKVFEYRDDQGNVRFYFACIDAFDFEVSMGHFNTLAEALEWLSDSTTENDCPECGAKYTDECSECGFARKSDITA